MISDIGYGGTKKLAKRQAAALVLEQLLDHPALSIPEPSSERSFNSNRSTPVPHQSAPPPKQSAPKQNAPRQSAPISKSTPDCHPVSRIAQIQQSKRGKVTIFFILLKHEFRIRRKLPSGE